MKSKKKKMYSKGLSECFYIDGRDLFGGKRNLTGKSYMMDTLQFSAKYIHVHTAFKLPGALDGLKKVGTIQLGCDLPGHAIQFLRKYAKGEKGLSRLFKDGKPLMKDTDDSACEDWFVLEYTHKNKIMVILFGISSLNNWIVYDFLTEEVADKLFDTKAGFTPNTETWHAAELMLTRVLDEFHASKMGGLGSLTSNRVTP